MADWRTIESAPKDGTKVLLFIPTPTTTVMHAAFYSAVPDRGWLTIGGGRLMNPTHWMPLPAPPERDDG